LPTRNNSNKATVFVASIVIAALFISTNLTTFFDVLGKHLPTNWGIASFAVLSAVIYGGGQFMMSGIAKRSSKDLRIKSSLFNLMFKVTTVVQYGLIVILALLIFQMALGEYFSLDLIIVATAISIIPAAILNGYMGYRIISWYLSDKKNAMLLLLGLSGAFAAVASIGNVVGMDILLSQQPALVDAHSIVTAKTVDNAEILNVLFFSTVALPLFLSTLVEWGGIALMLSYFSKAIGKLRYWSLISLPMLSFLAGILPVLTISPSSDFSLYDEQFVGYRIATTVGATIFIFIMGFAFLIMAKNIKRIHNDSVVVDYMTIAAFGLVMIGISFSSPVQYLTYPPYGVSSHWFVGAASYLASVGIYSSAISVSEDAKLRRSIRRLATDELTYLGSIGTRHLEQSIQDKVIRMTKEYSDRMADMSGIRPSLSDEEVKQYLAQVLDEAQKARERRK
jgi:hypothetical protein